MGELNDEFVQIIWMIFFIRQACCTNFYWAGMIMKEYFIDLLNQLACTQQACFNHPNHFIRAVV